MDFKVSRREKRLMSEGKVDVLVDNVCDVYPVFDKVNHNLIVDVEILTDPREELLDRAMFAVMKQRGNDPVEMRDGCQWAETIMGEIPAPMLVQQVHAAVREEGPGVRVIPQTIRNGDRENLIFKVELTNAV